MPSITTPETSSDIPWFLNTNYLTTRLAGELMKITDDDRAAQFLSAAPEGAQGILDRFLKLQNDDLNRSQRVELDRRFFGRHTGLRNTKQIGWALFLTILGGNILSYLGEAPWTMLSG